MLLENPIEPCQGWLQNIVYSIITILSSRSVLSNSVMFGRSLAIDLYCPQKICMIWITLWAAPCYSASVPSTDQKGDDPIINIEAVESQHHYDLS